MLGAWSLVLGAESCKLHAGMICVLIFQAVGEWEGVHQMVVGDFANLGHEQLLLLFSGKQMMLNYINFVNRHHGRSISG